MSSSVAKEKEMKLNNHLKNFVANYSNTFLKANNEPVQLLEETGKKTVNKW